MSDFLDTAADLLHLNMVEDKRLQFEKVFAARGKLQVVHSKAQFDLTNIESIFTALELGKIIRRVPGLSEEEIAPTISALKELMVQTLEEKILFPMGVNRTNLVEAPYPYAHFANLLKGLRKNEVPHCRSHSVSVITFNYDLAVDMGLYRAGLGPDYVIASPPFSDCIPLMKLHGSLNWGTENCGRITPLHLATYFQDEQKNIVPEEPLNVPLRIGSKLPDLLKKFANIEVNAEPVIVPPSWNKVDYHQTLSDVWAAAADHLAEAEYVFIIGYSLPETDSFFRHLYALGSVGKSPLRKLMVFDPDPKVNNRFKDLLGSGAISRYVFRQQTFDAAIEEIRVQFQSGVF